jgi:hypothetical protein
MNTAHSLSRIPVGAWLLRGALILNVGLGLSYVGLWLMLVRQDMFWRADFTAYYTGWSIIRDGQGDHLYDFNLQTSYQQRILAGRSFSGGLLPFINPPHAAIPFTGLAFLTRQHAFWIWSLGQVGLLVWLLWLLQRIAQTWNPHERRLMLSAAVAFPPLLFTFQLGTFSLLMLICLAQIYLALKRENDGHAGLWLIIGTVKLQLMVFPGLLLLGGRRWRALGSVLLFGAGVMAVCGALLGWKIWLDFITTLRTIGSAFSALGNEPTVMYNLKGTLTLILGSGRSVLINQIGVIALITAITAGLLLWRGHWRPDDPTFELRVALTMLLGLLFNLHLNPHDGLLVVLPAILFYAYLRQRDLPQRAYAAFVLSCPLLFLASEFTIKGNLGIRIPTLMMVALVVWMGKALADEQRTGSAQPANENEQR